METKFSYFTDSVLIYLIILFISRTINDNTKSTKQIQDNQLRFAGRFSPVPCDSLVKPLCINEVSLSVAKRCLSLDCLSVRPSVCHDPILYQNGLTYHRTV